MISSTYEPISCDRHDYLEIACLFRYRLCVELTDGSSLEARALDTRTNSDKEEFLRLLAADGEVEVRLERLRAITPLDEGARFGRVELTVPN